MILSAVDATSILVAVISGMFVAVPSIVVALIQRAKVNEVHRQTAPPDPTAPNVRTLAEKVDDLNDSMRVVVNMLGYHIADKHGNDPLNREPGGHKAKS